MSDSSDLLAYYPVKFIAMLETQYIVFFDTIVLLTKDIWHFQS